MSGKSGKFIIPAKGENPVVKWPVSFSYPNESGTTTQFKWFAWFEILDDDDLDDVMKGDGDDSAADDSPKDAAGLALLRQAVNRKGSDTRLMERVLKDLTGFDRADNPKGGFDKDVFDYVMKQPAIKSALVTAYFNCRMGRIEKN